MAGLTQEQINARIAELEKKTSSPQKPVADDEAIQARINELEARQAKPKEEMSTGKAALLGAQDLGSFGLSPLLSGVGGAIGKAAGTYQGLGDNVSFGEKLIQTAKAIPAGFAEGRAEQKSEEKLASEQHPAAYYGAGLPAAVISGGGLGALAKTGVLGAGAVQKGAQMLTSAPSTLKGAAASGLLSGGLQAAGHADTVGEAALDMLGGSATGGLLYGAGNLIGKTGNILRRSVNERVISAPEIMAAEKELGTKLTPGALLPQDSSIRKLESSLEQSPSLAGSMFRKEVRPAREAIKNASSNFLKDTTGLNAYETGSKIKNDLLTEFAEKYKPVAEKFENIRQSTAHIEVPQKSLERVSENIKNLPSIRIGKGQDYASKALAFAENLKSVQNVNELKQLATNINNEISKAYASQDGNSARVLGEVLDRVRSLESNHIKRTAVKIARTQPEGKEIAKGLINDLKQARKEYGTLMEDAKVTGKLMGAGKIKSPEGFMAALENAPDALPSEKVAKSLFDTNKYDSLKYLKEAKPNVYQDAKNLKLAEIAAQVTEKGEVNPNKFVKVIEKYKNPKIQEELLGGPEGLKKFKALKTLVEKQVGKYETGVSKTPEGLSFGNIADVTYQAKELLRYLMYKGMVKGANAPQAVSRGLNVGSSGLEKLGKGIIKATPTASRLTTGLLGGE